MTTHNAQNVFVLYFFFSSIVQTLGDLPKKGHTKSCFVLRFRHLLIGGYCVTDFRGSLSGHSFTGLKITTSGGGIELQDHCP